MAHLSASLWIKIALSLLAVSLTSLVGISVVAINPNRLQRALPYLISLAAGALLGVAGAHLLPEAIEQLGSDWHLSALLMAGFGAFFVIEKSLSLASEPGAHNHDRDGPAASGISPSRCCKSRSFLEES